jgi:hypothetical protein
MIKTGSRYKDEFNLDKEEKEGEEDANRKILVHMIYIQEYLLGEQEGFQINVHGLQFLDR